MRIAMEAAKFSDQEVNDLRKAMATFRRRGTIGLLEEKMVERMTERGYDREFAQRCFNQIKGFGEYGFPESHAASFAHLVYVSSWLKCHYPAAFACALLNSQPMGFYAPAQIVRDARDHGVEARAADVNLSGWDSTLEDQDGGQPALRLGLRQIDGLQEEEIGRLITARVRGVFGSVHDLWQRAGLRLPTLEKLAAADAFRSMGLDRRQALWEVTALANAPPLPLFSWSAAHETGTEPEVALPSMPLSEHVVNDYQTLRLSLKAHPMSFLRDRLRAERVSACQELRSMRDGQFVKVAGVILVRQRPGSAKGVVFMTLEDETGVGNCVVWPKMLERYRKTVMQARLMLVTGRIQRHESIIHVVATALEDRSDWLMLLSEWANEMPIPIANADEVKSPGPNPGAESTDLHARWARAETPVRPRPMHPRQERVIPKSRDFH